MKNFLVVTGNEQGIEPLNGIDLMNVVDAELKYSTFIESGDHFAVAMYKIEDDKIIEVKSAIQE